MNSRKWLLLANPRFIFGKIMNSWGWSIKATLNMNNEEQLYEEMNRMLPHQLEKAKLMLDYLLTNKKEQRLTHQNYQEKIMEIKCIQCGSLNLKKNGHKNGTQRYQCKDCKKYFSITTNTLIEKSVIKGMLDIKPIYKIAKDANLSNTQVYSLEMRAYRILGEIYNKTKLKDVVQIDEKYFRVNFKGTKSQNMPRESRESGFQNLTSGISKDQVCVIIAMDSHDNIEIKVAGIGPASTEMLNNALKDRIEPNSIIVTDSKSSYIKFCEENNLVLKQIPTGKHTVDEIYNLGELNSFMSEIETYVSYEKRGISSRHLQQHLDFLKYRKLLSYTYEYLEHNEEMYKKILTIPLDLKCRNVCKTDLPFDIEEYKEWCAEHSLF